MSVENVAIAVLFAAIGYFFGRRSIKDTPNAGASAGVENASIYRELFAAFGAAYSALLPASMEEKHEGQLTEETKRIAWDSLNVLSRLIAQTSFMLPQEMLDVLEEMNGSHLGMSWSDRLAQLSRVQEKMYVVARTDIGANAI